MAGLQRPLTCERVSTVRQGAGGPRLEGQRKVIENFGASLGSEAPARFTEVENGCKAYRIKLRSALHQAEVTGKKLMIAKLDRLSRNAALQLALKENEVRFGAMGMPESKNLTVGISALVAQTEWDAIARRSKWPLWRQKCVG
jgi:hypothetical protein